jgi:hypothetical protein
MSGSQMDKNLVQECFNTKTRQAMHREMGSSLTSVSGLRLKVSRGKTW